MSDLPSWLRPIAGGVELEVLVVPRAARTRIVGVHDGRLKVQLSAPPVEGEANTALIELISDLLGVKRQQISLASGATGRRKTVRIEGIDAAKARGLSPDGDLA